MESVFLLLWSVSKEMKPNVFRLVIAINFIWKIYMLVFLKNYDSFIIFFKVSQRKRRLPVTVAKTVAFSRRYCNAFSQRSTNITHEPVMVLSSLTFIAISIKLSFIFLKMQMLSWRRRQLIPVVPSCQILGEH